MTSRSATVEVELVPKGDVPQVAAPSPATDLVQMIERLAANPDVDVDKLQKILDMQKDIFAQQARMAFNAAFAEMQADIPTVLERATTNNGKYATLEDIADAVRPILQRHGFALNHRTEWPDKSTVRVVGVLTHRDGHSVESVFLAGADTSGNKNAIQALGSAISYGRRYTTNDLLLITTRGADDDGRKAAPSHAPEGFEAWWDDLRALADEGIDKLTTFWQAEYKGPRKHFCTYVLNHYAREWAAAKQRAERASKQGEAAR